VVWPEGADEGNDGCARRGGGPGASARRSAGIESFFTKILETADCPNLSKPMMGWKERDRIWFRETDDGEGVALEGRVWCDVSVTGFSIWSTPFTTTLHPNPTPPPSRLPKLPG